jgi:hypothetical protein
MTTTEMWYANVYNEETALSAIIHGSPRVDDVREMAEFLLQEKVISFYTLDSTHAPMEIWEKANAKELEIGRIMYDAARYRYDN